MGYHVLLAPPESYEEAETSDIEGGRYRDEPELIPGLDGNAPEEYQVLNGNGSSSTVSFESGGRTPVTHAHFANQWIQTTMMIPKTILQRRCNLLLRTGTLFLILRMAT